MYVKEKVKPVVLIADNDENTILDLKELLIKREIDSTYAKDPQSAIELLKSERINGILLDLSPIEDDKNLDFVMVLDFLKKKYYRVPVIVMSNFFSTLNIIEIHNNYNGIAIINKKQQGWAIKVIERIIELIFPKHPLTNMTINWDLEIKLLDGLEEYDLLENIKDINTDLDELFELIGKSYLDTRKVEFAPIEPGYSGAGVVKVIPYFVLEGDKKSKQAASQLFKYGESTKIAQEIDNYSKYILNYLKSTRRTELLGKSFTRQLGSIKYTFLNADYGSIVSFKKFYKETRNIDSFNNVLGNLFKDTLSILYRFDREPDMISPIKEYKVDKLKAKLYSSTKDDTFLESDEIDFEGIINTDGIKSYTNPRNLITRIGQKSFRGIRPVIHGDLNAQNIFIDKSNFKTWLIDFYSTGFGHIMSDFARLEIAIKFELLNYSRLNDLFQVENLLCEPRKISQKVNIPSGLNEELEKMIRIINLLRGFLSIYQVGLDDVIPYYLALFYKTADFLTFEAMKSDTEKRKYVTLSLCILGNRLIRMGA